MSLDFLAVSTYALFGAAVGAAVGAVMGAAVAAVVAIAEGGLLENGGAMD